MDRIMNDPALKAAHEKAVEEAVEEERRRWVESFTNILHAEVILLKRKRMSGISCKRQYLPPFHHHRIITTTHA